MDAPVEVLDRVQADFDPSVLVGRRVDLPKTGTRPDARSVAVIGWVLPRSGPAVAVEVLHQGRIIRRVPVNRPRPDLTEAFPNVSWAATGGFRTELSLLAISEEVRIHVRAILPTQERLPIGHIDLRPAWREGAAAKDLVSVIVPCYNQAQYLGEAIESALHQTYPHIEVVVVNDGSTDNSPEVARRYAGIRYREQENRGLSAARNTGLHLSTGSFVVFLDADDRLATGALETGLQELQGRPDCAFAAGQFNFIGIDGRQLPKSSRPLVERDHFFRLFADNYPGVPAAVMYRRSVLVEAGPFDGSMSEAADYDMYLRIARLHPVLHHGAVVADYRQHGGSMSRDAAAMLIAARHALRKQRPYARNLVGGRDAYREGKRFWNSLYGGPLTDEVASALQIHSWGRALRGALTLLRYHPRAVVQLLRTRALPRSTDGSG